MDTDSVSINVTDESSDMAATESACTQRDNNWLDSMADEDELAESPPAVTGATEGDAMEYADVVAS